MNVNEEAAADYREWLATEYVPVEGVDYDPGYQPTTAEIAAMWDEAPTACPACCAAIEVDRADPSVGIFGDDVRCADDCGWVATY